MPATPYPGQRKTLLPVIGAILAALAGMALLCAIPAFHASLNGNHSTRTTVTPVAPTSLGAPAASDTGPRTMGTPPSGSKILITRDGTYLVGSDIPAGQYRTVVPGDSIGCYWARLRNTSGQFDAIIANGIAERGEQTIITISAGDKAFSTRGCGRWEAIG